MITEFHDLHTSRDETKFVFYSLSTFHAIAMSSTAAFIKAAGRDTKAYLKSKGSNALVGYAAIDANDNWLVPLANYLSCDPSNSNSDSTAIDLYGLNN